MTIQPPMLRISGQEVDIAQRPSPTSISTMLGTQEMFSTWFKAHQSQLDTRSNSILSSILGHIWKSRSISQPRRGPSQRRMNTMTLLAWTKVLLATLANWINNPKLKQWKKSGWSLNNEIKSLPIITLSETIRISRRSTSTQEKTAESTTKSIESKI